MKVTGNTLIAFKKWYEKRAGGTIYSPSTTVFFQLPEDMKIGVFISFFDSVGLKIKFRISSNGDLFTGEIVNTKTLLRIQTDTVISRPEANTAAVEKADQLFNARSEAIDTNNI